MSKEAIKELSLKDFLNKSIDRSSKEKEEDQIEIPGWGKIPVKRPTNDQTLDFLNAQANSVKFDKKGNITETDLRVLTDSAVQYVYFACPYLQEPELQEAHEIKDPFDIPIKVFGIENVVDIANLIHEKFSGEKIRRSIKNS
ncbi:hypothetical protein [Clostridium sp. YIM B02500]|uniref:hypothetical protein n=1 Tax=Clostridium sp. YIM B02500 TaxID=2910681 RepID=UPI001EED9C9D|nr:hypothetical protein [Clostridium sp. YIM B02500]